MRGNRRIGGSAFTAHSGEPGCAAGAASAKHLAVPARIAPVRALRSANCPPARLCRRSFGLPTARAPAHNQPGQQGLKISTPTIDRLAGGSVQHGLSAAGGVYGFYQHCSAADKPRWTEAPGRGGRQWGLKSSNPADRADYGLAPAPLASQSCVGTGGRAIF